MDSYKSNKLVTCRSGYSGFSLLELMIVIVIVGVLATVAVPIYNRSVEYAVRAEGEATLGSIRTQVIAYYGEHGTFPNEELGRVIDQNWHDIVPAELDGHNFNRTSYYYQGAGNTYLVGLHRGDVLELHRSLNQDGVYEDWDVSVDE